MKQTMTAVAVPLGVVFAATVSIHVSDDDDYYVAAVDEVDCSDDDDDFEVD